MTFSLPRPGIARLVRGDGATPLAQGDIEGAFVLCVADLVKELDDHPD